MDPYKLSFGFCTAMSAIAALCGLLYGAADYTIIGFLAGKAGIRANGIFWIVSLLFSACLLLGGLVLQWCIPKNHKSRLFVAVCMLCAIGSFSAFVAWRAGLWIAMDYAITTSLVALVLYMLIAAISAWGHDTRDYSHRAHS